VLRGAVANDAEDGELSRGVISSAASCAGAEVLLAGVEVLLVRFTGAASGAGAERSGGRA
jgi:hypothetical protein